MALSSAATGLLVFLLLMGNTMAAISRSRADNDAAATAFVVVSYASLLLLFNCLRRFETTSPTGSAARGRARVGVWLTTTTLGMGITNCDMALSLHKAGSDPGSATCVLILVSYAALLALIWLLLREFAGQDQGQGGGFGAANAAH